MSWLAVNFISEFLLPPFSLILLAAAGVFLLRFRPQPGKRIIIAALCLLYLFSTPFFSGLALGTFQAEYRDPAAQRADAIVVLGAGTYRDAPEYGGDTVNRLGLERVRYAAWLHRRTGLPLLVSGGRPTGRGVPEAASMKEVLSRDFGVPVAWSEETSINTLGNARHSAGILRGEGIRSVFLVTHAWHMPRARRAFEQAGLRVVPAAVGFAATGEKGVLSFLPRAEGLLNSKYFFHEAIGMLWYELKF